jgi:GntR family transcriptional regulator
MSGLPRRAQERPLVDRGSPVPLWAQVLDDLRRRVADGHFDARFPTEADLTAHYGVSRQTVRQALEHLRRNGVIERQRGRGSRIIEPELEQPLSRFYSLARSIEASGLEERSEVLATELASDATAASQLGLRADVSLVHIARLRYAGDEPIALDRSWLPSRVARRLLNLDLTGGSLYDMLAERCGVRITAGRERIRPVRPTKIDAARLQLPPREAALRIERTVLAGDITVEWRVSLVRGDRFALVAEWSRIGT